MLDTAQNVFIIIVWVVLSMTCLTLLNQLWAPTLRRAHNDVIGWQISILGTIYAVMVGFMLYAVWANFQVAEANADNEANAMVNLYRAADGLPAAERDAIHISAANYADVVLNQEWPMMHRGGLPHSGQLHIMQLWATLSASQVEIGTQQVSLQQAMRELSDLTQHRRIRILESKSEMPTILWTVLIIGGMVTIGSCCLIGSENTALHSCLIFALSLLIAMCLTAIGDIDRPFQGSVHVSPYAFVRAQEALLNPAVVPP